jgi:formylmethanofuran dehydrogenase subunit E
MDADLLERLRDFHGHLGPWAMLGYRAGLLAIRELDAPTHFGVHATVHCPGAPPPSCFADGVQMSTGCTLGKANIDLVVDESVSLTVTVDESGATVSIRPRREVPTRFAQWLEHDGDEAAARRVLSMTDDQLFADPA